MKSSTYHNVLWKFFTTLKACFYYNPFGEQRGEIIYLFICIFWYISVSGTRNLSFWSVVAFKS